VASTNPGVRFYVRLLVLSTLLGSAAAAVDAQVPTIARSQFVYAHPALNQALSANCSLRVESLDDGWHWFPDQQLTHARALTRGAAVLALGEAAISIPVGNGADKLGAAQSGTALIDGYVPVPGKTEKVTLCQVDQNGDPIKDSNGNYVPGDNVTRFTQAILRFRLVTNFTVDPSAEPSAQAQREVRTVTTPEGGLVNVELSRYIFGWTLTGFGAFLRVGGGAGLNQITTTADQQTSYQGLLYASAQLSAQFPIVPDAINGKPASLVLSAEPFTRSLPDELRASFDNKKSFTGVALRAIALLADKVGVGVTYRAGYPKVPEETRWSIDVIYLR